MSFADDVYSICKTVPKGKVTTYKAVGDALGTKAYRAIGQALRKNPYAPKVPCHRVVAADGRLQGFKGKTSGKAMKEKKTLLQKEGVEIVKGKVVLSKHLFLPKRL